MTNSPGVIGESAGAAPDSRNRNGDAQEQGDHGEQLAAEAAIHAATGVGRRVVRGLYGRYGLMTRSPVTAAGCGLSKRSFAGSVHTLVVPVGSTHGHGRLPKNPAFELR